MVCVPARSSWRKWFLDAGALLKRIEQEIHPASGQLLTDNRNSVPGSKKRVSRFLWINGPMIKK